MKILALDYGTKRIGIALSDATRTLATPRPFLPADPFRKLVDSLKDMIRQEEISLIVVGVPRNMDGTYGDAAKNAQDFVLHLKEAIPLPVETVDERLSTVQAARQLQDKGKNTRKQKTLIDSESAAVFLQSYLDTLAFRAQRP
jgi:putative Holliday junction resolvase